MQTRGVGIEEGKKLLVQGFLKAILDEIVSDEAKEDFISHSRSKFDADILKIFPCFNI